MERMEHIRGKLLDGEKVVLDELDGYLGHHDKPGGRKAFYGYFEVPTPLLAHMVHEASYRLVLKDGRSGDIFAEIVPSNKEGYSLAEFHVMGNLSKHHL